jgi:hypothetical protein
MIVVNRIYTVLSVLALVLIVIFYLIHIGSYHNREYLLFLQNNTSHALQNSSGYRDLNVFNTTTSTFNINIGKIYLETYEGNTNDGRFTLLFSQTAEDLNFVIYDDSANSIGHYSTQKISPYYPLYVDFHTVKDTSWINLQYKTSSQNVTLYKLSVEFY